MSVGRVGDTITSPGLHICRSPLCPTVFVVDDIGVAFAGVPCNVVVQRSVVLSAKFLAVLYFTDPARLSFASVNYHG